MLTATETLKELVTMMDQLRINEVKLRAGTTNSQMAAYAQTVRGLAHLMAIYNSIVQQTRMQNNTETINKVPT